MSLLQSLAFPLRNPVRFLLLTGVHCLMLFVPIAGIVYSEYYDGLPRAGNAFALSIILLICYGIWLHSRALVSLKRIFTGGQSLPPLSAADFLPKGIRSVITSLVILVYVGMFPLMVEEMFRLARLSRSTYEWIDHTELASMLESNAVAIAIFTPVMLINLFGLARYAALGGDRVIAALKVQVSLIRRNLMATLQYLLRLFVLLLAAVLLIRFGSVFGGEIRPAGLWGNPPEHVGQQAWSMLGLFVYACGFVLVWNASLHLLAQYAKAIGICGDGDKLKNCKDKNVFTQESAAAWLTGGRRARP